MTTTLSVAHAKGGVGKTTVTLNLGAALAERGNRVLLVDFDPQGGLTWAAGKRPPPKQTMYHVMSGECLLTSIILERSPNLWLAPATINLAISEVRLMSEVGREFILREHLAPYQSYDYILIDCPPSLGLLTVNALAASDKLLIPVECEALAYQAMMDFFPTIKTIQRINPKLTVQGILPTKFSKRQKQDELVMELLRKHFEPLLMATVIPQRTDIANATTDGKTIFERWGRDSSDSTDAFRQLAEEIDG